jgi:hypothetical protein
MIKQQLFIEHLDTPVMFTDHGNEEYTIQYGCDRNRAHSYAEAAKMFGECLMHSMACAGNLNDPRELEPIPEQTLNDIVQAM